MKILIVNTRDMRGGTGRAAYRLHKALLNEKVDSHMLVQNMDTDDHTITGPKTKLEQAFVLMRKMGDSVPLKFYKNRTITPFSPSWIPNSKTIRIINEISPDIVHLHWICWGMIRIEDLLKITPPIVWTLHDMWPFTGGCHYNGVCEGYKKKCGMCNVLGSRNENDLSRKIFSRKKKIYSKKDYLTFIAPSRWLESRARDSILLKNKHIVQLPNPINTQTFKPLDKGLSRELWNLPHSKKLILFGAVNSTVDPRKGFKELIEAIYKLKSKNIEFVIFGNNEPKRLEHPGFKFHYLGHLYDEISIVSLYNAVDITVVPSLQEAFGQTACESMACGTPVVAFGHSGLLDIIEHNKNGYLAKPFDTSDLAIGIDWVLNNENNNQLRLNARKKIVNDFESKKVAIEYIKLYEQLQNLSTRS